LHRYIYGEDPASQNDFFGIVIHEMPSPTREIPKPVPKLRDLYKLNHTSYDKIIYFHTRELFRKFPLTRSIAKQWYMPNFKAIYGTDSEVLKKFKIECFFEELKLENFMDTVDVVSKLNLPIYLI